MHRSRAPALAPHDDIAPPPASADAPSRSVAGALEAALAGLWAAMLRLKVSPWL